MYGLSAKQFANSSLYLCVIFGVDSDVAVAEIAGVDGCRFAFAQAEVPIVCFLIAPDATRSRVEQLYSWVSSHQRVVVTALAGIVGIYLVLIGISKL